MMLYISITAGDIVQVILLLQWHVILSTIQIGAWHAAVPTVHLLQSPC